MKILVMGFTKLKYMPYMNFYLENIDKINNDIHVLYWNRDLKDEDVSAYQNVTLHEFKCYQQDDVSKWSKLGSFVKYRKNALKVIKEGAYDFIFVLHSLTGVLVADVLIKQFKNRYVFDYRDVTYEKVLPFRNIVGRLTKNSNVTFVSSDAYRRFLPENVSHKIYTSHNLLTDSLNHRDEKNGQWDPPQKIRLAFWGYIRHEAINKEIIRKIALDDRFELHYYGREQQIAERLKQYSAAINSQNVFFHGEYVPNERYEFVKQTHLLHNIYRDTNTMLAMGNKYYDGAIFRIPQLCFKGSFMGQRVEAAGIGVACDPYEADFTQKIYEYYNGLDKEKFSIACDTELERILLEYEHGCRIIGKATGGAEQ